MHTEKNRKDNNGEGKKTVGHLQTKRYEHFSEIKVNVNDFYIYYCANRIKQ